MTVDNAARSRIAGSGPVSLDAAGVDTVIPRPWPLPLPRPPFPWPFPWP